MCKLSNLYLAGHIMCKLIQFGRWLTLELLYCVFDIIIIVVVIVVIILCLWSDYYDDDDDDEYDDNYNIVSGLIIILSLV